MGLLGRRGLSQSKGEPACRRLGLGPHREESREGQQQPGQEGRGAGGGASHAAWGQGARREAGGCRRGLGPVPSTAFAQPSATWAGTGLNPEETRELQTYVCGCRTVRETKQDQPTATSLTLKGREQDQKNPQGTFRLAASGSGKLRLPYTMGDLVKSSVPSSHPSAWGPVALGPHAGNEIGRAHV